MKPINKPTGAADEYGGYALKMGLVTVQSELSEIAEDLAAMKEYEAARKESNR